MKFKLKDLVDTRKDDIVGYANHRQISLHDMFRADAVF